MSKRLLPLSFVAGLLGALALAAPAFANTDEGACLINGTATTNPPVLLSGGGGNYTFASGQGTTPLHLVCAGVDTTNNEVGVADVNTPSAGTYTNQVCGTGTADSTSNGPATVTTLAGSPGPGLDLGAALPGAAYHIAFTAGQGTFKWRAGSSISSIVAGSPADGVISIGANFDANQAAMQCTTHFTVTGAITGKYSGTN